MDRAGLWVALLQMEQSNINFVLQAYLASLIKSVQRLYQRCKCQGRI